MFLLWGGGYVVVVRGDLVERLWSRMREFILGASTPGCDGGGGGGHGGGDGAGDGSGDGGGAWRGEDVATLGAHRVRAHALPLRDPSRPSTH